MTIGVCTDYWETLNKYQKGIFVGPLLGGLGFRRGRRSRRQRKPLSPGTVFLENALKSRRVVLDPLVIYPVIDI